MSAICSPSQAISNGDGPVAAREIDASCRVPVLLLFLCAAVWLLIGSALGMIATLKFHMPGFLADCAWFTYGRVHPAHLNALLYGFAMQAGLGAILWICAHLGRTRLALSPAIIAGALLWNLGIAAGILGILYGENTGFEWLEMPRYAVVTVFAGYLLMGAGAALTIHQRVERQLYISQWFVIAALFWFPWIYSTASLLLVAHPVRGALQAGIDWWYQKNLLTVWFGFTGLAALFYFIPKIARRPLYSQYNGIFIFWTLALFGSCGGIPPAAPLPSWMSALSTAAAVLTVVPVIAVGLTIRGTIAGDWSAMRQNRTFKFFVFGAVAYLAAGFSIAVNSLMRVSRITNFTWYVPAQTQLMLYGFFAMTIFGAIYYIVPRLLQAEFPKPNLVCGQFLLAVGGILFYAAPLAIGGIMQGLALDDPNQTFTQVMNSTLMFLRISSLGDVFMLLGHLVLLLNLAGILVSVLRPSACAAWSDVTKPSEVAP